MTATGAALTAYQEISIMKLIIFVKNVTPKLLLICCFVEQLLLYINESGLL